MSPYAYLLLISLVVTATVDANGIPLVTSVGAMCSMEGITAKVDFDRPFAGKIYSEQFSTVHECIYYNAAEMSSVLFTIPARRCGTKISTNTRNVVDLMENRVYIQIDKESRSSGDRQYLFVCQLAADANGEFSFKGRLPAESPASATSPNREEGWAGSADEENLMLREVYWNNNWGNWPIVPVTDDDSVTIREGDTTIRARERSPVRAFTIPPVSPFPVRPPATVRLLLKTPTWTPPTWRFLEECCGSSSTPLPTLIPASSTSQATEDAHLDSPANNNDSEGARRQFGTQHLGTSTIKSPSPSAAAINSEALDPIRIVAKQKHRGRGDDGLKLEIHKGGAPFGDAFRGPIAIGETFTVVVKANNSPSDLGRLGIFAHSCYARDARNITKVHLIDTAGCALRPQLAGPMQRHRTALNTFNYFLVNAFKFPGNDDVYFTCAVDISSDSNAPPEMCREGGKSRVRRYWTAGLLHRVLLHDHVTVCLDHCKVPTHRR